MAAAVVSAAPAPKVPLGSLPRVLAVAIEAARTAGSRMRYALGRAEAEVKGGVQDLVTEVDKACQEDVERAVAAAFGEGGADGSGHHILGEESVAAGSESSIKALEELMGREWLWIVDPIDGTTNFVHGVPLSVVSVGVAHRGELVVGVIYDPAREELFTATAGGGAHLNGAPIRVESPPGPLSAAYLAFGTHTTERVRVPMLEAVAGLAGRVRAVRSFGSAAIHLAWVAAGRMTGFWELDLNSWDLAAGALLVREAGGRVSDTRGEPYTIATRDILASNGSPAVHDGLVDSLKEMGCERPRD